MQNTITRQLLYGERGTDKIKQTKRYNELFQKARIAEKNFLIMLKEYPKLLGTYNALEDILNEFNLESVDMNFDEGFKLGLMLSAEAALHFKEE